MMRRAHIAEFQLPANNLKRWTFALAKDVLLKGASVDLLPLYSEIEGTFFYNFYSNYGESTTTRLVPSRLTTTRLRQLD